jgi:hypothetical protein
LRHFELAVVTSHTGGDTRLLSQARAREQFEQSQRLTLRLIMPANDTAGTSQAEAVSPESDYIFTVRLRLDSSTPVPLGFAASNKQWIKIHQNILYYETEPAQPLYLVSSLDGNFQNPPKKAQIPIAPDTNYLLLCELIHEGNTKPVVWIFQYDAAKKVDSRSTPVKNGGARLQFKTILETESVAIGIRLEGKGKIDLHGSIFLIEKLEKQELEAKLTELIELSCINQKEEIYNSMRQTEAFVQLQHYLGPDVFLPDMHNWAISPDFGVLLVSLLEENEYDGVIEFGSGTSTLIAAKALKRIAQRNSSDRGFLLSFDHLAEFGEKTAKLLKRAQLLEHSKVVVSPLIPWFGDVQEKYLFYDCHTDLSKFRQQLGERVKSILVIVDGPPAATGRHARYPALPKILEIFNGHVSIDFILDDYIRSEEREIAARWVEILNKKDISYEFLEFKRLEKKACLIKVKYATNGNRP